MSGDEPAALGELRALVASGRASLTRRGRSVVVRHDPDLADGVLDALTAAAPPRPRRPVRRPQTAPMQPYRGGRGRFAVRRRDDGWEVRTRSGVRLRDVTVDADGSLVASALGAHGAGRSDAFERLFSVVERLARREPQDVHVHVPAQPPPVVHVAAPVVNVTVEPPKPRAVRVEHDADGNKRFVPEDAP